MKGIIVALLLFSCVSAWAKENPNPTEYTINVHVSKSFIGTHGEQRVDAVINGKKYELAAAGDRRLLALGDYKAKLVKDEHTGTSSSLRIYEFLFPDQKTRKFTVVGESE